METVRNRGELANQIYVSAKREEEICEELIGEQKLQKIGWSAVVKNLECLKLSFTTRFETFNRFFKNHLDNRPKYRNLIKNFEDDLQELSKIPILASLLHLTKDEFDGFNFLESNSDSSCENPEIQSNISNISNNENRNITMLQWITTKQNFRTINSMGVDCSKNLEKFSEKNFEEINISLENLEKKMSNDDYKEIKGLETRLMMMQKLFDNLKTKVQDQKDLAAAFQVVSISLFL